MTAKLIEYNNQKKTLVQWSKATGICEGTLRDRLASGWSIDKALTTAPMQALNGSKGKEMRTGVLSSLLKVWDDMGRAEFEKQLQQRFKEDAIKVVQSFQNMFPKEIEQGGDTPKTAIQINNIMPDSEFQSRFIPYGGQ